MVTLQDLHAFIHFSCISIQQAAYQIRQMLTSSTCSLDKKMQFLSSKHNTWAWTTGEWGHLHLFQRSGKWWELNHDICLLANRSSKDQADHCELSWCPQIAEPCLEQAGRQELPTTFFSIPKGNYAVLIPKW